MERTLLYYPTIDIPDMKWLYSSLLYSDKVSSIVPFSDSGDKRFPKLLKYLIDENQYKPIFIEKLLSRSSNDFYEFENFFIKTTSSQEFQSALNNEKSLSYKNYDTLYGGKMTNNIAQHLKASNLIKKKDDDVY